MPPSRPVRVCIRRGRNAIHPAAPLALPRRRGVGVSGGVTGGVPLRRLSQGSKTETQEVTGTTFEMFVGGVTGCHRGV